MNIHLVLTESAMLNSGWILSQTPSSQVKLILHFTFIEAAFPLTMLKPPRQQLAGSDDG